MEVLAFDLRGRFGHFKKFYTTSSPLTFNVPPPTAIYGMIGAVLGLQKEEYLRYVNKETTRLAIQILSPIKKIRLSLNHIDTKNSRSFHLIRNRTQIRTEFLLDPAYRIYVHIDNHYFDQLIEFVQSKKSYYTPSLGLANLLAQVRYVDLKSVENVSKCKKLTTIAPLTQVESIVPQEGSSYFKERLPVDMRPGRVVERYEEFLMEVGGRMLEGSFRDCYRFDDLYIALF